MKYLKLPIFISMVITSLLISTPSNSSENTYRFGVFPYFSPVRMDEIYSPISLELSKNLGNTVKFRTSSDLARFRERMKSEYYDFAIIQPFLYPFAVDQVGYIPLLRLEEPISSLIMVPEDSPIQSIRDLKGKIIATPPVFGPIVSLAKNALVEQGIKPELDVSFVTNKSIGACYQKILVGRADACVAPNFAVNAFEESMGVKFRAIMRSETVPNQSVVVHPRVSEQERNRLRETLLSWRYSETGRKLLDLMNTKGFVEFKDSEYDTVRSFVREMNK